MFYSLGCAHLLKSVLVQYLSSDLVKHSVGEVLEHNSNGRHFGRLPVGVGEVDTLKTVQSNK